MTIDTTAILERVTSRAYGWTNPAGAPEPVRHAAGVYQAAVAALDDALVEYEMEAATRRAALAQHNEAVTEALREGKIPPKAKVPSLEDIEVRHGALIGARETFVHEAASVAERVAQQHYPAWRADVAAKVVAAAAAVSKAMTESAEAVEDWTGAVQLLAQIDRNWAPRQAKLDGASVLDQMDIWRNRASIEATDMGRTARHHADRLRLYSSDPLVTEFDPTLGQEQYSAAYLAEQSPTTRADMERRSAESVAPRVA